MAEERWTNEPFRVEARRLMEERGLSLRELGRYAGIDSGFLARVLTGEKPPPGSVLVNVAGVLGVSPYYFVEFRRLMVEDELKNPEAVNRLFRSLARWHRDRRDS